MELFSHAVRHATESFETEGHRVTIEQFFPETGATHPAVIGLHGSGGVRGGFGDPARLLASSGFSVFLPHYFERTETTWADEPTIHREFPTWLRTIRDAITFAESQPQVDNKKIGLLGFSLGAYLALSAAAFDERVKAVVEYFGGLPEDFAGATRMPPVLILHGDADSVVPVREAERLETFLKKLNVPHEKKIYPGAGHVFSGMAMLDSAQRTLAFLRKHLA